MARALSNSNEPQWRKEIVLKPGMSSAVTVKCQTVKAAQGQAY